MSVSQPGHTYLTIRRKKKKDIVGVYYISWDDVDANGSHVVKFDIEDIDDGYDIPEDMIKAELQKYLDGQ